MSSSRLAGYTGFALDAGGGRRRREEKYDRMVDWREGGREREK